MPAFGDGIGTPKRALRDELRQAKSKQSGSGGCAVSRKAAARLLAHAQRHVEPADVILFSHIAGLSDFQAHILSIY